MAAAAAMLLLGQAGELPSFSNGGGSSAILRVRAEAVQQVAQPPALPLSLCCCLIPVQLRIKQLDILLQQLRLRVAGRRLGCAAIVARAVRPAARAVRPVTATRGGI